MGRIWKMLVLLNIIFATFAVVAAAPKKYDTIEFSLGDIVSIPLIASRRKDCFIWGRDPWDDAQVEIMTNKEITYEGVPHILSAGTYDSSGWICFDRKIEIGHTTPVYNFKMDLSTIDEEWFLKDVSATSINAQRISDNEYEITATDRMLSTVKMDETTGGPLAWEEILWTFTATITLK